MHSGMSITCSAGQHHLYQLCALLLSLSGAQHSLTRIHQQGVIHSAVFVHILLLDISLGSQSGSFSESV